MRWKDLRKDTTGLTKSVLAILIVVILLASTVVAVVLSTGSSTNVTVATGDSVTVNYIGTVMVQGVPKVFDTSQWSVATDNTTYLKTAWFTCKAQSSYNAFSFSAGRGQVVVGFDQGVIGMKQGETKFITIPPEQGYGQMVQSKLKTFNINETKSVFVNCTPTQFSSQFGVSAVTGLTVTDPVLKWPVTVISVDTNAAKVVYRNAPELGAQYHIYGKTGVVAGWNITITSIDSTYNGGAGLIRYDNLITNSSSWDVIGYSGSTMFVLINVDTTAGTAVMNFNNPLLGQTMTFEVTVVSIKKG